jgi:hypothetical protein
MDGLIAEWKEMKRALEKQLAAFDPPMNMHTGHNGRDTTEESKARVRRFIQELDDLLRIHGTKGPEVRSDRLT